MANAIYPKGKQNFLSGAIDLTTDDIRCSIIDLADYTYSTAHDFYDDVPAGARTAELSAGLSSKTVTDGVFDSADPTFSSVSSGQDQSEAVILYKYTGGADSARELIAYYDSSVTGLPITYNGGDVTITVNASGWFAL